MKKIETLSDAQKARFPEFIERWTKIGLDTAPADRSRAERAIATIYKAADLAPPKEIIWCGSPLEMIRKRASLLKSPPSMDGVIYGQHDVFWLAYYSFMDEVVGLTDKVAPLKGMMELAMSAGWALPHENICWVSERPSFLARDARGRLHNTTGPALSYPDGFKIYSYHGVRVPEHVIEKQADTTIALIDAEQNTEVRRVMIEIFSAERYIRETGANLIDQSRWGKLWQKSIANSENILMVEVINSTPEPDGTIKTYYLRVQPECRPMLGGDRMGEPQPLTALNAIASTFGLRGEQYAPSVQT